LNSLKSEINNTLPKNYSEAGVDVNEISRSKEILLRMSNKTIKNKGKGIGSILLGIGHYASLIDIGGGKAMALHNDGVGTKVLIAQMMGKFNTVGIDCVAMNVNDLICIGAKPIALLDYLVLKKADSKLMNSIMEGLTKGAKESETAIIGGETSIHSDLINGIGDKAFDLSATAIGITEKKNIITGSSLKPGHSIIGIASSGIHSNGLTLARKTVLAKYGLEGRINPLKNKLGEELLKPTRIYVKPILELLEDDLSISGLAHITGGGFTKLTRLKENLGFELNNMPDPLPIFQLIQKAGKISREEMYKTFNMGVGFCVFCPEENENQVIKIIKNNKMNCQIIGKTGKDKGVFLDNLRIN